MRASRLVSMLLLLQARGRLTAEQLATELEVSARTIYRDLEALSAAGVPVYAEPGRHGGIQLIDGYRTRLTGLTTKEAEALFAAGVPGPVGDLGLGTVLGAARLKLLAALPDDLAERASLAAQRFHVDAPGWFRSSRQEPHLATLATAVWEDRRVDILYRHPGDGPPASRSLDPLGLVCKAGTWYLVARRDGELRTYRVSRVGELTVRDERFTRPPDFDLARFWTDAVADFEAAMPTVEVLADVSPDTLGPLEDTIRDGGGAIVEQSAGPRGRTRCRLAFDSLDEAFGDLVRLGAGIEVREPAALRSRLAETASAVAAVYAT
jgi:predicted DNA-binding transcriptional regulator YafY